MRTVHLENDWFQVTILPDVGAKIYDLIWKPAGRNVLWHNPRIEPQSYPVEGIFDNYWCGGWDDCFPTCDACVYRGEQYPSLGELRSLRWTVDSSDTCSAKLSAYGPISPVRVSKRVTLDSNAPVLRLHHSITNIGTKTLDFIWGTHPALNVSSSSVLRIPACTGIVGEASSPMLGIAGRRYPWPFLPVARKEEVDMSRIQPANTGEFCGHYVTDLQGGWWALEDTETEIGFAMKFPRDVCRVLWLWLTYGGYRGHYHAIIEPWTSMPVSLSDAVQQGTHRTLAPGEQFEVKIAATGYSAPESLRDALKRLDCEETNELE